MPLLPNPVLPSPVHLSVWTVFLSSKSAGLRDWAGEWRNSALPALLEEVDRVSTVSTSTRGAGAGRMAWDG